MLTKENIRNAYAYCKDDIKEIEGYNEAVNDDKKYVCHHRNGLNLSKEELIMKGLYYHRPADELIFLSASEHIKLHKKGKHFSEEHKQKLSDSHKGEKHPMYGKHHSKETKQKMSDAKKGENNPWYGKGYLLTGEKNPMYGKKQSEETKQKISDAKKGTRLSDETKQKLSDATKGEKNGRAKQCTINGTTYGCLADARRALYPNMPYSTFLKKYKNNEL